MATQNATDTSNPILVSQGGTGASSLTAYSVLCGGTTTTGVIQSVSGLGSSGQVLTSNGASALPTWQAAPGSSSLTVVQKTSNQSVTNSTILINDNQLSFSISAGLVYSVRFVVFVASTSATPGFKWQLLGPIGATSIIGQIFQIDSLTTTSDSAFLATVFTAGNGQIGRVDGGASVTVELSIVNGLNAGTVNFQWAQITSNGTATTVYAGSYIEYTQN